MTTPGRDNIVRTASASAGVFAAECAISLRSPEPCGSSAAVNVSIPLGPPANSRMSLPSTGSIKAQYGIHAKTKKWRNTVEIKGASLILSFCYTLIVERGKHCSES